MLISASKIITKSVELYREHWRKILEYVGVFFVSILLLIVLQQLIFPPKTIVITSISDINATYIAYLIYKAVFIIVLLWLTVGLIKAMARCYKGKKPQGMKNELEYSAKHILSIIGVSIAVSLTISVGFLLLIIPGIIFSVWFNFALYRVALEDETPITAMKESKELVEGRWWSVLWRLFLPAFVLNLGIFLIQGILIFVIRMITPNALIINTASGIASLFLFPVTLLAAIILYIELKKTPVEQNQPHPEPNSDSESNVIES